MDFTAFSVPALTFAAVGTAVYAGLQLRNRGTHLALRIDRFTQSAAAPVSTDGGDTSPAPEIQLLREQKYSNWALLDQMIARRSWAEREAAELTRANVPLRVGEFMLVRALIAILLVSLAWALTHVIWFGLPLAIPGFFAPRLWVKSLQQKRRRKFDDQLVDAIQLLASTLKSGYSFLQGMEAISRELPAPISEEFDLLVKEIGVGSRAEEALIRLIERVRSQDLELVVTAIMIQRTVGGELAGVLENIARTVRERQKIMRDVSTLTAQQRWSGYIIGALPVVLVAVISFVNPGYTGELFFTLHGQVMLGVAIVMEMIGFVMIRKIIAIDV
jgi:tight adherence protein B